MLHRRKEERVKQGLIYPNLCWRREVSVSPNIMQIRHNWLPVRENNASFYIGLTATVGGLSAAQIREIIHLFYGVSVHHDVWRVNQLLPQFFALERTNPAFLLEKSKYFLWGDGAAQIPSAVLPIRPLHPVPYCLSSTRTLRESSRIFKKFFNYFKTKPPVNMLYFWNGVADVKSWIPVRYLISH